MDDKIFKKRAFAQGSNAERRAAEVAQSDAAPNDDGLPTARKVAVLVAGMHRSGTSALARMLSLLGCDLPKTLLPGGPGNEPGHWESWPILNLNHEILASAGSSWDDWEAFNPAWCDSPVKDGFLERALKTLEEEFGASRLFVLKDPRICRLLPFWNEALEAFGAAPRVVCPLRHPIEVAASLERRDGIDPSIGRLLWLRHMLDAEVHSRGLRRAFLRYDALLAGWRSLPDRLGRELGLAWPRRSSAVDIEIDGFLSPAFRHHAEEDAKVLADPDLSRWIRTNFEIFDRWTRGQGRDEDCDELDQVRAAFDEAAPAFARLVLLGRQAARRSATLEAELETEREGSAGLEAAVMTKQAELGQREAELAESQGRVSALSGVVAAKDAELAQRDAELVETRARIEALDGVVAAREAALAQRDAELAETRGRIEALDGVVAAKEAELAQRDAELVETRGQIEALDGVVAAKEAELAQRDAELVATRVRIEALDGVVAAREAELDGSQQMVAAREAHAAALDRTITALRRSTSWKVTAPLRWADLGMRRARYSAVGYPVTLGVRALMTWSRAPLRDYRAARAIRRSELFDRDWYLKTYPDVGSLSIDPVRHYVAFGAREGRDPGLRFSTSAYLFHNPDVRASGTNPLFHFVRYGQAEGRRAGAPSSPDQAAKSVPFEAVPLSRIEQAFSTMRAVSQVCELVRRPPKSEYALWIAANEPNEVDLDVQRRKARDITDPPLVSVVMPVYKVPAAVLEAALRSLQDQTYPFWEACIAYADVENEVNWDLLTKFAADDPRIRAMRLETNGGISANSNAALRLATGEFVALLDHDDALTPWAFHDMTRRILADPAIDFLYSDKDCIDESGTERRTPLFKPEWSPEMLYSVNYLTHLCLLRRSILNEIGGWRSETDGAQDWDIFLRVCERARRIARVPGIHYHWRIISTSVASGIGAKPYALEAQWRVQQDRVRRLGLPATVERHDESGFRLVWNSTMPVAVDLVIRGPLDHSRLPGVSARIGGTTACRVSSVASVDGDDAGAFEQAIERGEAPIILFVDGAVRFRDDRWIDELIGWVRFQPEIAFAGAIALTSDDIVVEAGRAAGDEAVSVPLFRGTPLNHWGWFGGPLWFRNVSAVTPYSVAFRRDAWAATAGADEHPWPESFAARCVRARNLGRRGLVTPHARAYVDSMPPDPRPAWDDSISTDPYFHPAFCSAFPLGLVR